MILSKVFRFSNALSSKPLFAALGIALLCMAVMSGCSDKPAKDEKPAGEKVAQQSVPDVEVWVHQHAPLVNWLKEKADQYNLENKDVHIVIRAFPSGELPEKVYTAVKGGMGPAAFDFLCLNYKSLIDKDIIAPVDWKTMGFSSEEQFASQWFKTAIEGVREKDGNYYALPYTGNTWSLFINREHFKEAGLDPVKNAPKTWEEVADVAQKLTVRDENGRLTRKGFDLPFSMADHWWFFVWGPVLSQCGGSVLSSDGQAATINEKAAVDSLRVFYDLVHKYKVTEAGLAVDESEDFKNGTTSMWISGVWSKTTFKGRDIEDKYMAVPLPQIDLEHPKTIIGGYWWHVSNKADPKIQKEAWKFLNYITSDSGDQFKATGLLMPKPSIMDSQAWKEWPYNEVFSIDLAAGEWPVSSPVYPQIEKAIADAMQRSLVSDVDPQKSLYIAADAINKALKEH